VYSGSGKLIYRRNFHNIFRYLRTLCMVWSLLRRRVTRRLTRLQTMRNTIKYSKIVPNSSVRLRFFFQFTYVQYCTRGQCCFFVWFCGVRELSIVYVVSPARTLSLHFLLTPMAHYSIYTANKFNTRPIISTEVNFLNLHISI